MNDEGNTNQENRDYGAPINENSQQGNSDNGEGTSLMADINLSKVVKDEVQTQIKQYDSTVKQQINEATNVAGFSVSYFAVGALLLSLITLIICLVIKSNAQAQIDKLTKNLKERNKEISELKEIISTLDSEKINKIESKLKSLDQKIKLGNDNQSVQPSNNIVIQKTNNYNSSFNKYKEPSLEEKCSEFINAFNSLSNINANEAVTAREDFAKKFKLKSFVCANSDMLINNPNLAPIFIEESDGGYYWAYEIESGTYAVVPNVATYTEDLHSARAMGKVFKSNFDYGKNYSVIKVTKPAIFKGMWNLETCGRLELS